MADFQMPEKGISSRSADYSDQVQDPDIANQGYWKAMTAFNTAHFVHWYAAPLGNNWHFHVIIP